jgi:hypothetical protein
MTSKELIIGPGKITSSDLQGPLAGKQISDLVDLMKNGKYMSMSKIKMVKSGAK